MPEETKAQIQATISNLRADIYAKEENRRRNSEQIEQNLAAISRNNSQLDILNSNIRNLNSQLEIQKAEKSQTILNYNSQINEEESKKSDEGNNLKQIKEELSDEVYLQTGLSVENAKLVNQLKDAQLFLTSVDAMLKNTETQMDLKQDELDKATNKTDNAKKEEAKATTTAKEKSVAYKQTEDEAKVKAEQKEEKEQKKDKQEYLC